MLALADVLGVVTAVVVDVVVVVAPTAGVMRDGGEEGVSGFFGWYLWLCVCILCVFAFVCVCVCVCVCVSTSVCTSHLWQGLINVGMV